MIGRPWYEKEYRRVFRNLGWPDTPEGREELKQFNPKDFVKQVRAIGGKVVTCDAQSQWYANYDSKFGRKHPAFGRRDILKNLVSECHKVGIKFIAYIPACVMMTAADEHPEWIQRYADGSKVFQEDNREKPFYALCLNSPFRKFRQKQLAEICTYGVDGFFFDGAAFYAGKSGKPACYCQYCRDKYYREYHHEIPVNPGAIVWMRKTGERFQQGTPWEKTWKQFLLWRYRQIEEAMRFFADVIHLNNPKAVVINNCFAPFTDYFSASSFGLIETVDQPVTEVCMDIEGGPTWGRSLWTTYLIKTLRALNDDRPVLSYSHAPGPDAYRGNSVQVFAGLTAGGIPDICIEKNTLSFGPVFTCISELKQDLIGSFPVKWGGLVISEKSRDFYGQEYHRNYWDEVQGIFQISMESHLNMNMVPLLNKKKLGEYAFLVLGNTACLSNEELAILHSYVKTGGGLVVTYQSGLFDQWGCERNNSGFATMFSIDIVGTTERTTTLKLGLSHEITEDQLVKAALREGAATYPGTSVLLRKKRKGSGAFCEIIGAGEYPFVIAKQYGKGRVVYIAGDIGKTYLFHPYPFIRQLLVKSMEWVASRKDVVSIEGPQTLLVGVFQQKAEKKIIVHLLNTTYPKEEKSGIPSDYSELIPLHNIKVVLNEDMPQMAYLSPGKVPVEFNGSSITIEKVKKYHLLVLQY